jgi:transposase-like protein
MTTDKHPAYTQAIRWIVSSKVLHRHNRYLNNRMERNQAALLSNAWVQTVRVSQSVLHGIR